MDFLKNYIDDEQYEKVIFALRILEHRNDFSYGLINSDVDSAIDTLVEFTKEIIK